MLFRAVLVLTLMLSAPLAAQQTGDYRRRAEDLRDLAKIFGELHQIRRSCEPGSESEVWRNRMRKLIDLEMPTADLREDMIRSFNVGFRRGEEHYEYCDRDARRRAANLAEDGNEIATRLLEPLYNSLAAVNGPQPFNNNDFSNSEDDGQ